MATVSIAILGLNRTGASLALALKRYNATPDAAQQFDITTYDGSPTNLKEARESALAPTITDRLHEAVSGKDIIVTALPYADIQPAMETIARYARPGVVVLDTSPLKLPAIAWARQHLPKEMHYIGATPVVNPQYLFEGVDTQSYAHEDLFDQGNLLLMPGFGCAKEAVQLASDFAEILRAAPHFIDPAEHDSVVAAVEGLPALLGLVAYQQLSTRDGWLDAQRMINTSFGQLTHHLFDTHPDDLRDLLLNNRDNMVRYIDQMLRGLTELRDLLARGRRDDLETILGDVAQDYEQWFNRRYHARWQDVEEGDKKSAGGEIATAMFGSFLANRLWRRQRDEDKTEQ